MISVKKYLSTSLIVVSSLFGAVAPAMANEDLVKTFNSLEAQRKGPFGLNYLQGSRGRSVVTDGGPSGTMQFQAAFRNDIAQGLASKYNFYLGNLFTTNYYELMGEYVYQNKNSSHDLNHQALVNVASQAMPKATLMVQHWILEKHYIHQFPNTKMAKSFALRGISGSEFEVEYAKYFFNFYLSGLENDMQYLTASLLAKGSPIVDSASLERARTLIASKYDSAQNWYNKGDESIRRLYMLRNTIHNQLSYAAISDIDAFMRDFSQYRNDSTLLEIRKILVTYYTISAKNLMDAAKKINATDIMNASLDIQKNGSSFDRILNLSNLITALRANIMEAGKIPYAQKTDSLLVLNIGNKFLNKELSALTDSSVNTASAILYYNDLPTSKKALKTVLNLLYIEGFLIKDNWEYFSTEMDAAADATSAITLTNDVIGIASDTLHEAFLPALDQWLEIQPKMQYFMDNTLKSSSISTASILAGKLKH